MKSFGRLIVATLVGAAAITASIGPAQAAAPILIKILHHRQAEAPEPHGERHGH